MSGQDCEQLTLFQEDFPASRLALPGSAEAVKMTVTSGLKCCELLKNCGPVGLLARMLLESSTWHSTRCYLNWKPSATPAKRLLFRLVPSTPRTGATDARLWRTPGAVDADGRGTYATFEAYKVGRIDKGKQISLTNQAKFPELWPTPTPTERISARKGKPYVTSTGTVRRKNKNGTTSNLGLSATEVLLGRMYPTPTVGAGLCGGTGNYQQLQKLKDGGTITEEERRNMASGSGGQLNPDWVCRMMGFPDGWLDIDEHGQTEAGRTESRE